VSFANYSSNPKRTAGYRCTFGEWVQPKLRPYSFGGIGCLQTCTNGAYPAPNPGPYSFGVKRIGEEKRRGYTPGTPNLTVSLNQRRQPMFGECSIIKWPQASSMAMLQGTLPCTTVGPPKGKGGCPLSSPTFVGHCWICGLYRWEVTAYFKGIGCLQRSEAPRTSSP